MAAKTLLQSILERASAAVRLTQNEIKVMATKNTPQTTVERASAAVPLKPGIGQRTDTTTVRLRSGTTCDIEEGAVQIASDLRPELGGRSDMPGPSLLLRVALGACFAQTAALWAAKLGVPIDHLEVEVETDPRRARASRRWEYSSALCQSALSSPG